MNNFYFGFLEENSIVSITDKHGKITYVNDKFCKISKYSRKELIGQKHSIINSGYHPKELFADMWKTISNGKTWRGEICNRAKDGSLYWVESFIKPELDLNGKPIKYYSFRIIITKRKKREEEQFYQTVEKLGAIFENSHGFQFFIAKNRTLLSFNKSGGKIPKILRGSKIGKDSGLVDFSSFLKHFEKHFESSLSGQEIVLEQKVDFLNNGKATWFLVTYYPVDDNQGKITGVSITAVDIDQRKTAEIDLHSAFEQKRALISSIPDPIFFKDGKGKWLIINTSAMDLFQVKRGEWAGKTDLQMVSVRPLFKEVFELFHNNDELTWIAGTTTEMIEFVMHNGSKEEFNVSRYPIYYEDGRRKAMVVICHNITELKKNREKLKKQNNQLMRIAWLQAHTARAPVARILGLANIIKLSDKNDPLNEEIIARMVECAQTLDNVIHEIMDNAENDYEDDYGMATVKNI